MDKHPQWSKRFTPFPQLLPLGTVSQRSCALVVPVTGQNIRGLTWDWSSTQVEVARIHLSFGPILHGVSIYYSFIIFFTTPSLRTQHHLIKDCCILVCHTWIILGIYRTPLLSGQPSIAPTTSSAHCCPPSFPRFIRFVSMGTKKSDSLGCVVSGGRKRCKPQPIWEYSTNTDVYH